MISRITPGAAVLATVFLASCYPYPENPEQGPNGGPQNPESTVTSQDQQKIQEQRDRMKEQEEQKKKEAEEKIADTKPTVPDQPAADLPKPPTEQKRADYPFANPVPGKDGFVFSPFNNKVVDVRDIPSGTLVMDPTYPAADKKYFRVP